MNESYIKARNKAWDVLIECEVSELPVDLWRVARDFNIGIHSFVEFPLMKFFKDQVKQGDGFAVEVNGVKHIAVNGEKGSPERQRFTLAHELGHCLLNHPLKEMQYLNTETDDESDIYEYEANIFARTLLMPEVVLAKLGLHTYEQIMKYCGVSEASAKVKAERMDMLYKEEERFLKEVGHTFFGINEKEKQVYDHFKAFIQWKKDSISNLKTEETTLFKTAFDILETMRPGESKDFDCPDCGKTAYCSKVTSNGSFRISCTTCKTGIVQ